MEINNRDTSRVTRHTSPGDDPSRVTRHTSRSRHASRVTRHAKITEGPLSSRALFELSLLSTTIFVFAALLLQFLLTLCSSLFLKIYAVTFQYSLFAINYQSESSSKWPDDQIYFIFATGPVLLSATGFLLLFLLKKMANARWKIRLVLTWLAFLMVNALPCGILAGVFFYDGFGVAFHWLIGSIVARGLIALSVFSFLVAFSNYWQRLFFKTSYTSAFLDSGINQKKFINNVFLKPWIYGFLILLFFNWPFSNLFWRAFLLSLGFMSISLIDKRAKMSQVVHIRKSRKKIFTSPYQPFYFALALALVWVADNIIINF
ncbi:MAG: hypothetical protein NTW16_00585 [Bacteroidetes bacterium]|nr:hypothetical protein [Bacteroidota bacterium]